MGNRQDGMWTGKAGEIFGVRREEIGAVVLGDGRRGGGGALLGVWCEEMGRAERASFELGGKRTNFTKIRSHTFQGLHRHPKDPRRQTLCQPHV